MTAVELDRAWCERTGRRGRIRGVFAGEEWQPNPVMHVVVWCLAPEVFVRAGFVSPLPRERFDDDETIVRIFDWLILGDTDRVTELGFTPATEEQIAAQILKEVAPMGCA